MTPQFQHSQSEISHKRKRVPWLLGIIVSIVLIAILTFTIVTLLILRSQGISQGINTLTIISIIVGFIISILSLLVSFLQWHHPKSSDASKPISHVSFQTPSTDITTYLQPPILPPNPQKEHVEKDVEAKTFTVQADHSIDWGESPHIEQIYGRDQELTILKQWIRDDHCRIVAILGIGGIGKTSLVSILTNQIQDEFSYIFWRSLQNAPPLKTILQDCIKFLSDQHHMDNREEIDGQIALLLEYLRRYRCLLVFDNVESILQSGKHVGSYQEGYQVYGKLFQLIGETKHRSSLLLTSRETPQEIALLRGNTLPVRTLSLQGVAQLAGQEILKGKGLFGSDEIWNSLINLYSGNPLALKLVGELIREVFGGNVSSFLRNGEIVVNNVFDLLAQQFVRLAELEQKILYWLAIEREAVSLDSLSEDIVPRTSKRDILSALESLRNRAMLETRNSAFFELQSVIKEYVTSRFIDLVCEEIASGKIEALANYAIIKAQAKEYVRESQVRLVLIPVMDQLLTIFGKIGCEEKLRNLLFISRQIPYKPNYVAGNILNFLVQFGIDLSGYDLSHLTIWQAYLQDIVLQDVDFSYSHFAKSVFTNTFGSIYSVAWSPDEKLLAAGTSTGEIRLWDPTSTIPLMVYREHTSVVTSLTFTRDGTLLASGSGDGTVRLWEVNTNQCLNILQGHADAIMEVVFSSDGSLLASGSLDRTIHIYQVSNGNCLHILEGHTNEVQTVAFSPDCISLVSGSLDQTLRIWQVDSGECLRILKGHTDGVESVAFSPDGTLLASGSQDGTVRIWRLNVDDDINILVGHDKGICSVAFSPDGTLLASSGLDQTIRVWQAKTGKCLHILEGHSNWIISIAFSPGGTLLASGGLDQTVRIWEVSTGHSLHILQGYTNRVHSIDFSPDGTLLASAHADSTISIWEVSTGISHLTLKGHNHRVHSVAFSPDGTLLASGSLDQMVRIWEVSTGTCVHILRGHSRGVYTVTFSPNSTLLASGSEDHTVRLWEVNAWRCLHVLQGHTNYVLSIAFNSSGTLLASGSYDGTVRIWQTDSGDCLHTLRGSMGRVRAVTFSSDGTLLASGSLDGLVHIWQTDSGDCLRTLRGHNDWIYTVAFNPDSTLLATGSQDSTIWIWQVNTGNCLRILKGHSEGISSVAFSPDGTFLASSSLDGTILLWDVETGKCLKTLRGDRPYERMNISNTSGLTIAQKATLKELGAIDNGD